MDEILNLIGSVSEVFSSYSCTSTGVADNTVAFANVSIVPISVVDAIVFGC